MERRGDWEERLTLCLAEWTDVEFAWGQFDCALFMAASVKAMTGTDVAAPFRGYTTRAGAMQALRDHGAGTLLRTLDELFDQREPAFLRRGDLAWHEGCVGVVYGGDALFVGQEGERDGLVRVPRADWAKGWAVG